ncbi:DedA family protein [Candidatus Kaiserbacteria bacterium]|nr:DedA family protein [Candidatus Kaiserbacteria bacterium]
MPVPAILSYAISFTVYSKYFIIFFATTFGGPVLSLASGFLLHEGLLDLVPIFLVLSLGELTWDACWYAVGYSYADRFIERFGRFFSFTPEMFEQAKKIFDRYHGITLFMNKLFMGLGMGIAVLVTGGATKMSFWKYMLFNALGEVIWVSGMLYIGYFYAGLYGSIANSLKLAFLIGTISAFAVLVFGGSKYLRKKVLK